MVRELHSMLQTKACGTINFVKLAPKLTPVIREMESIGDSEQVMIWKLVQLFAVNSTKGDGMNVLDNKQVGNRELRQTVIEWLTDG